MNLQPNECEYLTISSAILDDWQASPEDYVSLTFTGSVNNGVSITTVVETLGTDGPIQLVDGEVRVFPVFFNLTSLVDGVYSMRLTALTTQDTTEQDATCYFHDCSGLRCRITMPKQLAFHYALTHSNGCVCDCVKMHTVYEAFLASLTEINHESDCGC